MLVIVALDQTQGRTRCVARARRWTMAETELEIK
jgi:hypothetical protein